MRGDFRKGIKYVFTGNENYYINALLHCQVEYFVKVNSLTKSVNLETRYPGWVLRKSVFVLS